ncbi:MAG: protein-methionine-sulfoxide reductase catalytic subunit MsrP [Acidiferrobacteraceae bacterium]|nr:protein-methionine-sulfoxide reductase catalytic subunit MsrP [Acidiferrobacteraceae bacterium]
MTRVTDPIAYKRRKLIVGALGVASLGAFGNLRYKGRISAQASQLSQDQLETSDKDYIELDRSTLSLTERRITQKYAATNYNNAYEFGWNKSDPAHQSGGFTMRPWSVTFDGLCHRPGTFDVDDLMGMPFNQLEERIYDFRCVEAWSMVIPYNGRPLRQILKAAEPMGSAKYVAFTSIFRPEEMPGQTAPFSAIEWPYVEGLTIEEAMHPLAFATFGVYGDRELPQNGMPFRITLPWKYGFKSAKFVVRVTFMEKQPPATWNQTNPREYGWYSNVYPDIDHPRWSQSTERRIWGDGDIERIKSLPYNGYGGQVAHLYPGDNKKYR